MKFVVSSSSFLKQLGAINGAVASNPILPITENFLFHLENSVLTVTASDLQTIMVTKIEVESADSGSIAVPAKLLLDTLRGLPEQPITLKIDTSTFGTEIISENGRYKLSGENPVDFPKVPTVNKEMSLDISASVLGHAIASTLFAASNEDLRPAMTGMYLSLTAQNATFVATDGHRLVRYRREDVKSSSETSLIIPRKALNLLKATLPNDETAVVATFGGSFASFSVGNVQMVCRLIDERFPDYENAIPTENPNVLSINRLELLGSLRRIAIYANKTSHQIRLKLAKDALVVSAEDPDYENEASERLLCDYDGKELEIGFNAKFLVEMLSNLSSNMVQIHLSEPNRAGILIPSELQSHEDVLMLVMPVMLNTYA